MKPTRLAILALACTLAPSAYAADPAPALNQPDMVSWELFTEVNAPAASAGNNNVLFETWASDQETFTDNPVWPSAPPPLTLHAPVLLQFAPVRPGLQPRVLPFNGPGEEVRRNKVTFDYIVNNNLYKQSGLAAAFAAGQEISFPVGSIEVKANWVPIDQVSDPSLYHVNTAGGRKYALISMHIISKQIPNWTWATFEHQDNKGRCDYIGCRDNFGAVVPFVAPEPQSQFGKVYPPCRKSAAVLAMFTKAKLAPEFQNYCLKGSQIDFITSTGLPTLLGNSVTEDHFSNTSSCMACHSRAAFDAKGHQFFPMAGFIDPPVPSECPVPNRSITACSPNGAPQPSWFWSNPGTPQQKKKYMQADFVWSVPFLALPK